MKKTIAIDFDGVIHKYSKGGQNGEIYDQPFDGVFEYIEKLMEEYNVFIFSARSPRQIKEWLMFHCYATEYETEGLGGNPTNYKYRRYNFDVQIIPFGKKFWSKEFVLGITRKKLPATLYIDDKGLRFEGDGDKTIKDISKL